MIHIEWGKDGAYTVTVRLEDRLIPQIFANPNPWELAKIG